MVFAGLLVSLIILAVTWIIVTMAECGLTIGMIVSFPFVWIIDKIFKLSEPEPETKDMTEDELKEYWAKEYDGTKSGIVYNKHLDMWFHI